MELVPTSRLARILIMALLFTTLLGVSFQMNLHTEVLSLVSKEPVGSALPTQDEVADIPALREKCDATRWVEGLYMKCDYTPGGVGNQVYLHLACIRYAIEAGAGITLPLILRRDDDDLGKLDNSKYEHFDYLFDVEYFKAAMQRNCPQMTILDGLSDLDDFMTAHVPEPLHPADLYNEEGFIDTHWREFQPLLLKWLGYEPSIHAPAVVRAKLWMCEWDVHDAPQAFFATFGRILRFRPDTRAIAARIMDTLHRRSGDAFLGVHLRTEADVTDLWTSYETQTTAYMDEALSRRLTHIYVASGDAQDVLRFQNDAQALGLTVYSKHDLLDAKDAAALATLAWDQQALVDYEVLRLSTYFIGIALSSFSCILAFSRHNDLTQETVFSFPVDQLSKLVGEEVPLFHTGIWPI